MQTNDSRLPSALLWFDFFSLCVCDAVFLPRFFQPTKTAPTYDASSCLFLLEWGSFPFQCLERLSPPPPLFRTPYNLHYPLLSITHSRSTLVRRACAFCLQFWLHLFPQTQNLRRKPHFMGFASLFHFPRSSVPRSALILLPLFPRYALSYDLCL